MKQGIKLLLHTCVLSLLLSACGGGGGGSSTTAPVTPANLRVTNHDGYTTLQWDGISNATTYNIYWSTRSGVSKTNGQKITHNGVIINHGALLNGQTYYYVVAAENSAGESAISAQVSGNPVASIGSGDPLFNDQWHLKNTGQPDNSAGAGTPGEDINVETVWNSCTDNTCRGEEIRIAVIDGGIEINHPDLVANVATGLSYNYLNNSSDPSPNNPGDAHGTAVAGIIASRNLNGLGGHGVAPRANLVGYNALNNFLIGTIADAMTRGSPAVHISSNSWGPPDNGDLQDTALAWRTAINTGLTTGRHGLGTIYVWAAGNGGYFSSAADNSNYDGQANQYGVIAVGAVNDKGTKASYSEPGANVLISAPGGEFCNTHAITTTDLTGGSGFNTAATAGITDYVDRDYTKCMNGTSAATPVVSGAVALILQANPNLGWRDVRNILATTARQNDALNVGWTTNGAGHTVNHEYGFGVVDTAAAVTEAKSWINLGPQLDYSTSQQVNLPIPDNNINGRTGNITIAGSGISNIEFIEITFNAADHTYSGDLEITLTRVGPNGATSILAETHGCLDGCTPHNGWVFSSVRHLDEPADGDWILTVKDLAAVDTGTFQSWGLKFYGH